MARFDVHENPVGEGYLLDVQADALDGLNSRVVVPLMPVGLAPKPAGRLNPEFRIEGRQVVMVTQFIAAVGTFNLGPPVASISDRSEVVINALDLLLTGV